MKLDPRTELAFRSKSLYDAGDFAGALRVLESLIYKLDRNSIQWNRVQALRATCECRLGNLQKARKLLLLVNENQRDFLYWTYAADVYRSMKDKSAAHHCIMTALRLAPNNFDVQQMAGVVLHDCRNFLDAEKAHRAALKIGGNNLEHIWSNLGNTLEALGKIDHARIAFIEAITLKPDFAQCFANWANLELRIGHYDKAIELYHMTLRHDPSNPSANFGLGLIALTHGNYKNGASLYEWRWRATQNEIKYPWPRWRGVHDEVPNGGRLLLISEQGFGDTLMMLRFLPILTRQFGMEVTLLCDKSLRRLVAHNFSDVKLADEVLATEDFDFCLPLMGLLYALNVDPTAGKPEAAFHKWRAYLASDAEPWNYLPSKIGYCWKGSPLHDNDRNRSIDQFSFMQAIDGFPQYRFTSLVHGDDVEFEDWLHTARVVDSLDLIITVDTAVAHLAGAMGKEVWLLLPYAPDWRWMIPELCDETSPWYPSMRLFRQDSRRTWEPVLQRVREALTPARSK